MNSKSWSPQQKAIFADVASGEGHTLVLARAGTGKTTTIVEAVNYVPTGKRVLMVAFNKAIAGELKTRIRTGVEVSTLHSLGFKALQASVGRLRVEEHRVSNMLRDHGIERYEARNAISRVVGLAKGTLVESAEGIDAFIDAFDVDVPPERDGENPMSRVRFCQLVQKVLEACRSFEEGVCDFDDMVWAPVVLGARIPRFDRVFVDETQDLNAAQLELVVRACKDGGRICAVGDDRQAIYRFRGADENAVGRIIEKLSAKVLPLSVTYRCSRSIVKVANRVVPDLEAAPDASEGEVSEASLGQLKKGAEPGDFVLSRTNAPLVSLCLEWIALGKRATIAGRDVGAGLLALIDKLDAPDVGTLRQRVEVWANQEIMRLTRAERDPQAVEDKRDCLLTLSDAVRSVEEVKVRISALFSDTSTVSQIVLSSTHKAKGLERDRVWMLADTYNRRPSVEESNLFYVAVTRAKRDLRMVH